MKCACGNEARYIDATGALTCSLCPLKAKLDSIRISDVPTLLAWCRDMPRVWRLNVDSDDYRYTMGRWIDVLHEIIGRDASNPSRTEWRDP